MLRKTSSSQPPLQVGDVFDQTLASSDEKQLIQLLRQRLGDDALSTPAAVPELSSDIGMLRFIRGYQGNLHDACFAFLSGLAWRSANGAVAMRASLRLRDDDDLDEETLFARYADLSRLPHWDKIGAVYPERFFHRRDNAGNPIMITSNHLIDNVPGLLTAVSREEYEVFRTARHINLELLLDALSRKRQRLVKCVYIWDLKGFSYALYSSWQVPSVKAFFGDYDARAAVAFPESALRIVAVNVPGWLSALWAVAKRVVPARTLRKIIVVGTSNVTDTLVRLGGIPATAVPRELGGSCPPAETARLMARPAATQVHAGVLDAPAGEKRWADVAVPPRSHALWGVLVPAKDCTLSVELRTTAPQPRTAPLFALARVDAHAFPRGAASAGAEGATLRVVVDNSKSFLSSKRVEWCVVLHPASSSLSVV